MWWLEVSTLWTESLDMHMAWWYPGCQLSKARKGTSDTAFQGVRVSVLYQAAGVPMTLRARRQKPAGHLLGWTAERACTCPRICSAQITKPNQTAGQTSAPNMSSSIFTKHIELIVHMNVIFESIPPTALRVCHNFWRDRHVSSRWRELLPVERTNNDIKCYGPEEISGMSITAKESEQ